VEVVAQDVTFLGGRDGSEGGGSQGGSSQPASKPAAPSKKPTKDDVVIEDIGDEPINLDDIPF